MTIRRLLKDDGGAQEIERLNRAYKCALRSLHLVDRNDPISEIVAKTVIAIGATGIRDPAEISKIAVKRLETPRRAASKCLTPKGRSQSSCSGVLAC